MSDSAARVMIASRREDLKETVVLRDELAPVQAGEIRLRVDKVGLSANNLFYAQMGDAPFLKFFARVQNGMNPKGSPNVNRPITTPIIASGMVKTTMVIFRKELN